MAKGSKVKARTHIPSIPLPRIFGKCQCGMPDVGNLVFEGMNFVITMDDY